MNYDIIIVGASFSGLSLAHHLPKNLKILVVDRKPKLNATIESTGLITQATYDMLDSFCDVQLTQRRNADGGQCNPYQ